MCLRSTSAYAFWQSSPWHDRVFVSVDTNQATSLGSLRSSCKCCTTCGPQPGASARTRSRNPVCPKGEECEDEPILAIAYAVTFRPFNVELLARKAHVKLMREELYGSVPKWMVEACGRVASSLATLCGDEMLSKQKS